MIKSIRFEWLAGMSRAACVAAAVMLTGCASHYVDGSTREIDASRHRKPAALHPVQVVFEFQTKGAPNAQATQALKPQVLKKVRDSGLFSAVEEKPVAGGGLLSVKINNVPLQDDAFRKGFVTGMTFGLAGSKVSDGYVCTLTYLGEGKTTSITKTARHAIHTTLGAATTPGNAKKAASIDEAATLMTSQIVSTALNELSQDDAFAAGK